MRALTIVAGVCRRLSLAARYYTTLGYSWHLAWVKAAR